MIEYFILYQDGVHWQQEPAIIGWDPDIVGYSSKLDAWHAHCMIQNHIHRM